jgi:hypothetical protein
MLTEWEKRYCLRADGELLLGDGQAVAWRELLNARQRQVLVKSNNSVSLRPVGEILAVLSGGTT